METEKYDSEALNEMCSSIDLLEYASQSMDFKKRGYDSFSVSCPLHQDLTPSLFITPSKNLFYCQSCGVGGNLINWLMTFEHMKFPEAVKKVSELSGVDIKSFKTCSSMALFKELQRAANSGKNKKIIATRKILNLSYMGQFIDEPPQEWLDEGISAETMKHFGIRIDNASNRIVYPVYDANFNLIAAKGRTRFQKYKEFGIKKYLNYQQIGTTDYFAGMKENYEDIMRQKSVVIFEGLKSVMKLYDWDWNNAIATETKGINDSQIILLIKMGLKEVTFADDNDVPLSKIRHDTEKLRRYTNVYAVIDSHKLLPENKMAPCDAGREVWEQLYSERIKL